MDCELCGNEKATQYTATDWGERHICDNCAPQVQLTIPRESPGLSESPVEEDRFKTAAERFLQDLGIPRNGERPPNNPK
jgi:ribosome-binding protein aMBF1 (putative translation factor)